MGGWLRIDVRKQVKTKLSKVTVAILGVVSFFVFVEAIGDVFAFVVLGLVWFFLKKQHI